MKLRLPHQGYTFKTSEEDPIDYYYKLLVGQVYRYRLRMALKALGEMSFDHLLEIGYGSGIFLPALSDRARQISGFDLHGNVKPVQAMLAQEHVQANLWMGDVTQISTPSGKFDAVICLSVLEHLTKTEVTLAISEIARVSRPGGRIVLGFPRRNIFTNIFYRIVGFNHRSIHPVSHEEIHRATEKCLWINRMFHFLPVFPKLFGVYTVYQCTRN